ncbi:sugar ABC transporter permease [Caldovatus sediminis]|uniref:Sugar ABC transporter permease n=1 Tax=Caldovatus sediminis TaxID=2041189 RepID=A0A8J3EE20_9PROT|nr:sugar ABC transporter permease [Caldovatus sediminis]GGG48483.1 sugar ABC transporter permease [Caldovatus sediminis]
MAPNEAEAALAREGGASWRAARRAGGLLAALRDQHLGVILLLPSALTFLVLLVFPLGYGIWTSFFQRHVLDPEGVWVGLGNYVWLFGNREFWHSLTISTFWAGATVGLQIVLGTAVALLLHQPFKGRSLVRGLVLFPYMMPVVSVVLVWMLLYNALYGVINYLLVASGIVGAPIAWLSDPDSAFWGVVFVGVWKYLPFVVVIVLARLQVIPQDLYEAARIDGAGAVARFLDITLHQIKDVLLVVALLRTIFMFNNFEIVFLLTGGGPLRATMTLPILVYEQAFGTYELGRGSAIAVVMFFLLIAVMSVYFAFLRKEPD